MFERENNYTDDLPCPICGKQMVDRKTYCFCASCRKKNNDVKGDIDDNV